MAPVESERRPMYGNWQKPRSRGLGRLGLVDTGLLGFGLVVAGIVATVSPLRGLVVCVVTVLAFVPRWVQDSMGRSLYERWRDWARFRWHRFRSRNIAVGGPLSQTPTSQCWVPGLAASIEIYEGRDGAGNDVVLLHHPAPGHVTAVIECSPPGTGLVDPDTVDSWVAHWGEWLADLGHDGAIAGVQVVVETRPDPGVELGKAVEARLVDDAPRFARETMSNVVAMMPAGSSRTRVWVTITWSRSRFGSRRERPVHEVALDIIGRLPELCGTLNFTGAGHCRPVDKHQLAAAIRSAYDPGVLAHLEASGEPVDWSDAGPLTAVTDDDVYRHDNAVSLSWLMGQAPAGVVRSNVLEHLLRPHPQVPLKRVTMLYRPYTSQRAATIVEKGVETAEFQARQTRRGARSRDVLAIRHARKMADDEASGAGLVRFGMVVTATVWNDRGDVERDVLERAASVIEQGSATRIRFRRAKWMQDTAFLAGLPLGVVLPGHVRSLEFRD